MASNYTSNYQLCQWEGTDKVLRTDFNGDNAKIDAALKANADAIAAKAAQTDLEEVAEDLAAETTAREAADTALEAKVGLHLLQTATHDGTSVSLMSVPLTGINWSQRPVMILEMGFMTNQHDDLAMAEDSFRQIMAKGIAEGIDTYFEEAS